MAANGTGEIPTIFPMPPRSDFFYADSTLKTYATNLTTGPNDVGDMPFFWFTFFNGTSNSSNLNNPMNSTNYNRFVIGNNSGLMCAGDPVTINTFTPDYSNTRRYQANLDLLVTNAGKISIYPTINIFELVNDRIYLIQLQHTFNSVPQ